MQSYTECEGPACVSPAIWRDDFKAHLCDTHAGIPTYPADRLTASEPWGRKHGWLFKLVVMPIGAVVWAYVCLRDRKLHPFG